MGAEEWDIGTGVAGYNRTMPQAVGRESTGLIYLAPQMRRTYQGSRSEDFAVASGLIAAVVTKTDTADTASSSSRAAGTARVLTAPACSIACFGCTHRPDRTPWRPSGNRWISPRSALGPAPVRRRTGWRGV